jgi:hypothetical protein
MKTLFSTNKIFYSINDAEFKPYNSPLNISENSTVRMFSEGVGYTTAAEIIYERDLLDPKNISGKIYSDTVTAVFFKAPAWKSISIRNAYAPQYSAGGDRALIDGLTGTTNFRTGLWQGYEGVDLIAVIDLGTSKDVDSVTINFLCDQGSWIFPPWSVTIDVTDSETFMTATTDNTVINNDLYPQQTEIQRISVKGKKGRYVHVIAKTFGNCPAGHLGEGKPAWLFADEIMIKTK